MKLLWTALLLLLFNCCAFAQDLHNLEVQYSIQKDLYKSLYATAAADINLIHVSLVDDFLLFPAYEIGVGLNLGNLINAELTATNKHMNLNTVHQGHSLSESPLYRLRWR